MKSYRFIIYSVLLVGMLHVPVPAISVQQQPDEEVADSLRQVLTTSLADTARVNTLNKLSDYYRYRNLDSLSSYSAKAIELSGNIGYEKGRLTAYADKSWELFSRGEYEEAIETSQTALNFAYADDYATLKGRHLQTIGISYGSLGSYKIAAEYFIQAKEIFEELNDLQAIKTINNNLGVVYLLLEDYNSALDIFLELDAAESEGERTISTAVNLGFIYYELKDFEKAEFYLTRALNFEDDGTDPRGKGLASFKLGEVYAAQNRYDAALELFDQSISIYNELENEVGTVQSLNAIAEVHLERGNIKKAKQTALKADEICVIYNALPERRETTKILSEIYKAEENYKKALEFFELHKSIADSLFDDKTSGEIARLETAYEFEKQQRELIQAQRQKELETQQQLAEQRLFIYIIAGALVVAIVAIFLIYRNYKLRKKANEMLGEKNREIEKKTRDLQETNRVKNRLFSIISHDLRGPISSLSNMISLMEMGALSQDDIEKITPQLADRFRYTSTLLNNLLFWARSQMDGFSLDITTFNLIEVINDTIELLEGKAKEKEISIKRTGKEELLVNADKSMLQLVLLNLVSNAVKFTKEDGKIGILADNKNGQTVVCVSDNGVGIEEERLNKLFDANFLSTKGTGDEKGTGLGLMLCKDFVEKHNGKIWVESEPGKGSSFYFSLPN